MRRSSALAAGSVAALLWALTGCFLADQGPSRLSVLNSSGRSFWLDDDPANDQSRRFEVEPGGYGSVSTDECTERPVEAQTETGEVIATIDREWCPGQLWVIRGQDDWSLGDAP